MRHMAGRPSNVTARAPTGERYCPKLMPAGFGAWVVIVGCGRGAGIRVVGCGCGFGIGTAVVMTGGTTAGDGVTELDVDVGAVVDDLLVSTGVWPRRRSRCSLGPNLTTSECGNRDRYRGHEDTPPRERLVHWHER